MPSSTNLYQGIIEQPKDTFLRLTANPYTIITRVYKQENDGADPQIDINPINGTVIRPSNTDCTNWNNGIIRGTYNLGKFTSSNPIVTVVSDKYRFTFQYWYFNGPGSGYASEGNKQYGETFALHSTSTVSGYIFNGWAVGSEDSNVIIPPSVTQVVLDEQNCLTCNPVKLRVPSLYNIPSTTLDLYALWRVSDCGPVTINVSVGDNSPIIPTITMNS